MNIKFVAPLDWPLGRPRTNAPSSPPWKGYNKQRTIYQAAYELVHELKLLKVHSAVASGYWKLNSDGWPLSDQPQKKGVFDAGIALYFSLGKVHYVLSCDRWDTWSANLRALTQHIDALRKQERWGVGTLEEAFAGFKALPPPPSPYKILGVADGASQAVVDAAYKQLAKQHHPDNGGSEARMSEINWARDVIYKTRGW